MAKEFEFMDEKIALQQRPLGNYADALGKSYKDLEDRLRSEQGGGGFWSDLGKNFLQAAVVQPLAEQATEAVSGVINDPFKENNLEFYEEKEQKEAARKYNNAYASLDTLNTSEKARRDSGMTQLEWETRSPEVLRQFREAFKVRAAEEGWNAAAFTDAQIDGLTYDYRKQRAEKTVSLREEMLAAGRGLRSKEDMVRFHETFNKRGKGLIGAAMNFIGRPIRGDFVDKAAKDFLESDDLKNIVSFQELRKRYQETGDFEDMVGDVYGIDIEANSFGIAKEIKTIYKDISGETYKVSQVKTVNKRTGLTETSETKIGDGPINPNKEALKNVPTILDTIKKFNFSNGAKAELIKKLNTKYVDDTGKSINLEIPYRAGNAAYNITNYDAMMQEVLAYTENQSNFVNFDEAKAKNLTSQRNQLLRNSDYLMQINALNVPRPSDPSLVVEWEKNKRQAQANMQNYQTAIADNAKVMVGIEAGQINSEVINGVDTAVPKFHKLQIVGKRDGIDIIKPVRIPEGEKGAGTDEEVLKAVRQYNEWLLGRRDSNLVQPIFGRGVSSVDDATSAVDDDDDTVKVANANVVTSTVNKAVAQKTQVDPAQDTKNKIASLLKQRNNPSFLPPAYHDPQWQKNNPKSYALARKKFIDYLPSKTGQGGSDAYKRISNQILQLQASLANQTKLMPKFKPTPDDSGVKTLLTRARRRKAPPTPVTNDDSLLAKQGSK